ncbi:MAG: hypothetical protein HKO02_07230 [Hyphomonadaceae bacterium]|nr:hypothetical protein [Hyphomonadaceae bacterium]
MNTGNDREKNRPGTIISSLSELKIERLRQRDYQSNVSVEAFSTKNCIGGNTVTSLPGIKGKYKSYMAAFTSDGVRQYARVTVPDKPAPTNGFPTILFLHGYIGKDKAPNYSIGCRPENMYYSELTDAFARAGYAVLSPGYRGHASVNGEPAEGIEYLEAFDQGAGLSTQFYAIDALNFAAGILDMDGSKFPEQSFKFDMSQFFMVGHSQGGDAGLTYLAVTGEGHRDDLKPVHAALWSGAFINRLTALEVEKPMEMTSQAFLSGDGSWTGTAIGKNDEENPNFIFGYPPDWIETPDPQNWTWQKETWSEPDVKTAAVKSATKMYVDLEAHVDDLLGISFEVSESEYGTFSIRHDPRIARLFPQIGGFYQAKYLQENITFHVPEKDHYSRIEWNRDLCDRILAEGGDCDLIIYPHNNHSMRASKHEWFSPAGTKDGYPQMIKNMTTKFSTYKDD